LQEAQRAHDKALRQARGRQQRAEADACSVRQAAAEAAARAQAAEEAAAGKDLQLDAAVQQVGTGAGLATTPPGFSPVVFACLWLINCAGKPT
jgi:hypothetical protein